MQIDQLSIDELEWKIRQKFISEYNMGSGGRRKQQLSYKEQFTWAHDQIIIFNREEGGRGMIQL